MAFYLITYDLRAPDRNYDALYKIIKSYGTYCRVVESSWVIKTPETASEIWQRLSLAVDKNDSVLVIKVDPGNREGWLFKELWKWFDDVTP